MATASPTPNTEQQWRVPPVITGLPQPDKQDGADSVEKAIQSCALSSESINPADDSPSEPHSVFACDKLPVDNAGPNIPLEMTVKTEPCQKLPSSAQQSRSNSSASSPSPSSSISEENISESAKGTKSGSSTETENSVNGAATPPLNTATTSESETKQATETRKSKSVSKIDHILKALNSLQTTEERLAALCNKYTELFEAHTILQMSLRQSQKKISTLVKEKEQQQCEHSKVVFAKNKLESLCRELQKHNKLIKADSLQRAKEEDEKRKELSAKFQTTIVDIQKQMSDNYERNVKLQQENTELGEKLKQLLEHYETREQQLDKVFKHRDLENQLSDAKLEQVKLQAAEAEDVHGREKKVLQVELEQCKKKIDLLEAHEDQLKKQIAVYTEKYDEFQKTLTKSNDVFSAYKTSMEKMAKKIKKVEKEATTWKQKWEESNRQVFKLNDMQRQTEKIQNEKVARLENLCRALQAERRPEEDASSLPLSATDQLSTSADHKPSGKCDGDASKTESSCDKKGSDSEVASASEQTSDSSKDVDLSNTEEVKEQSPPTCTSAEA